MTTRLAERQIASASAAFGLRRIREHSGLSWALAPPSVPFRRAMPAAPISRTATPSSDFPRTSWTFISQLQQLTGEQRKELFEGWIKQYWKPIYAYFRAQGQSAEQAEDLVQSFLANFLENDKIQEVAPRGQRFRSWLRTIAKNFLVDSIRHDHAAKRHPSAGVVSLEALRSLDGAPFEPPADGSPDDAFNDAWRREVLQRAFRNLEADCRQSNRVAHFDAFVAYYVTPLTLESRPRWEDVAGQLGFSSAEIAERKAYWIKRQLARLIWAEVRRYVETDAEADDEIRELLA